MNTFLSASDMGLNLRRVRAGELDEDFNISRSEGAVQSDDLQYTSEVEMKQVGERISEILKTFEIRMDISLLSAPAVADANALALFPGDRTLVIELDNWSQLSEQIVRRLAEELRELTSDWRIILGGRVRDAAICIYKDGIAAAGYSGESELKSLVAKSIAIEVERREATVGRSEKQFQLVKDAWHQVVSNGQFTTHVIKVFDNWRGESGSCVIWVFHRGASYAAFSLSPRWDSLGKKFEVKADGSLHELYDLLPEERIGYLVETVRNSPLLQSDEFEVFIE